MFLKKPKDIPWLAVIEKNFWGGLNKTAARASLSCPYFVMIISA